MRTIQCAPLRTKCLRILLKTDHTTESGNEGVEQELLKCSFIQQAVFTIEVGLLFSLINLLG